jgi:N-hydroxyarylamine O-acetyltransferase
MCGNRRRFPLGGRTEQPELATEVEFAATPENLFGVAIPDRAAFEAKVRQNKIVET